MTKRAVIVIDLQKDYFPGYQWPLVGIDTAAANAARVIADARKKGVPVIHIQHEFTAPDAPFFVRGTEGVEIHPSVAPLEGERVILKHYPNSFRETSLKTCLDEQGIEAVTIVGAMSHMCIDAGVRAAADFGYEVTVVHDACATLDLTFGEQTVPAAQVHAAIMSALAFAYASVKTTNEYLSD